MDMLLDQSAVRRARDDWWTFFGATPGQFLGIVVTIANALVGALVFQLADPSGPWRQTGIGLATFITIELAAIILSYIFFLVLAFKRQRDEVRLELRRLTQPTAFPDVEIRPFQMRARANTFTSAEGKEGFGLAVELDNVRITNRSDDKVSLGFRLCLVLGPNRIHWLNDASAMSPINMEAKVSLVRQIMFSTIFPGEKQPAGDLLDIQSTKLLVTDYVTGQEISFAPAVDGYPSLRGVHREALQPESMP